MDDTGFAQALLGLDGFRVLDVFAGSAGAGDHYRVDP